MGGRGSSSGKAGGKTPKAKAQPPPYTTDKDGVRNYEVSEEGGKAFYALSGNTVHWNKGADVFKELPNGKTMQAQVKRAQMWDFLNNNGMNEFILDVEGRRFYTEKQLQRVFNQLADHGYYVVARYGNGGTYYVSRKSYQHLTLDFKTEAVYKRGVKD